MERWNYAVEAGRFKACRALTGRGPMILGLSCSHNATVCVLDACRGRVAYCASEERFTRRRQEWGFPGNSLGYALANVVSPEEITRVAIGERCEQRFASRAFAELLNLAPYAERDALIRKKSALARLLLGEAMGRLVGGTQDLRGLIEARLAEEGIHAPVYYVDHHEAHAASAFFGSPFQRALVVTLDGECDGLMGSIWQGQDKTLTQRKAFPASESVGLFYKMVTALLGYRVNRDEGKVMALAMRGDASRYYPKLASFLSMEHEDGRWKIESPAADLLTRAWSRHGLSLGRAAAYMTHAWRASSWEALWNAILQEEAERLFAPMGLPPAEGRTLAWQADVAAAAQRLAADCVVKVIDDALARNPAPALAVAGGIFANVCINRDLLRRFRGLSLYIHPGMGDEGLAFGAASLCLARHHRGKVPRLAFPHVFVGPEPSAGGLTYPPSDAHVWTAPSEPELAATLARALAAGRVAGICRGPMEYGPRALGNRSILAHPGIARMPLELNQRLGRSPVMPFAPSVLDGWFKEIFAASYLDAAHLAGRFMTVALPVRAAWRTRLPAVVHEDGTARPQRLERETTPFLYGLVREFTEETGLGCVLNTSFNRHGEPIVRTALEAMRLWEDGAVDILVAGDTCYAREPLEAFGTRMIATSRDRRPA